jgi:hypothetical protein
VNKSIEICRILLKRKMDTLLVRGLNYKNLTLEGKNIKIITEEGVR